MLAQRRHLLVVGFCLLIALAITISLSTSISEHGKVTSITILPTATREAVTAVPGLNGVTMIPTSTPRVDPAETLLKPEDYLSENAECELPCWWGITPGITVWANAKQFLGEFMTIDEYLRVDGILVASTHLLESSEAFEIPRMKNYYFIDNEIVSWMEMWNFDNSNRYSLRSVVRTFGPPSVISIRTIGEYGQGVSAFPHPFRLEVYYIERGIAFEYAIFDSTETINHIEACFQDLDSPIMYLWRPEEILTFQEAAMRLLDIVGLPFPQEIEVAAGLDESKFYETLINELGPICLRTDKSLWP